MCAFFANIIIFLIASFDVESFFTSLDALFDVVGSILRIYVGITLALKILKIVLFLSSAIARANLRATTYLLYKLYGTVVVLYMLVRAIGAVVWAIGAGFLMILDSVEAVIDAAHDHFYQAIASLLRPFWKKRVRWANGCVTQVDFVLRDANKAFSVDEEDAARDESDDEDEHFQTRRDYYAWLNDMYATKIQVGPFAGRLGYVIETDSAIFTDVKLVGSDAVELIHRAHIEEGWCGHAVQVAEEDVHVGRLEVVEEEEEDVPLVEEAVEEEEEVLVVGLDGDVVDDDDDNDEEEEEDQRAVRIIGGTYAGKSCFIQERLSVMVRIKLVGSGKVTCIMPSSLDVDAEQQEEVPAVEIVVPVQVEAPILRRSPRLTAKKHR